MRGQKRTSEKVATKRIETKKKYIISQEREKEIRAVLSGYDYKVKDKQSIQSLLRQYCW